MAEYEIVLTPTERKVQYLDSYLFEIWTDLTGLAMELDMNKSLKDFPRYRELTEVTDNFGKYVDELNEYCKDVTKLVREGKDWLENTYEFLRRKVLLVTEAVEDYSAQPFREHMEDSLTEPLKKCEDLREDIGKSLGILKELYLMEEVEPELAEKSEMRKKEEFKKIVIILITTGLGFGALKLLSMPMPRTGLSILPIGNIVGFGFEMLALAAFATLFIVYVIVKITREW